MNTNTQVNKAMLKRGNNQTKQLLLKNVGLVK